MDAVGKILGESQFSTQFNDTLALMVEFLGLKDKWFRDVEKSDAYWYDAISSLILPYEEKYGKNNGITDRLWLYIPTRSVTDDYWSDIRSHLLCLTLQAIKSGKLDTGEDAPETAWTFSGDLMKDPDYMTTAALKAIADTVYDGNLGYVLRYAQYVTRAGGFN